jgi:hypothetical protein
MGDRAGAMRLFGRRVKHTGVPSVTLRVILYGNAGRARRAAYDFVGFTRRVGFRKIGRVERGRAAHMSAPSAPCSRASARRMSASRHAMIMSPKSVFLGSGISPARIAASNAAALASALAIRRRSRSVSVSLHRRHSIPSGRSSRSALASRVRPSRRSSAIRRRTNSASAANTGRQSTSALFAGVGSKPCAYIIFVPAEMAPRSVQRLNASSTYVHALGIPARFATATAARRPSVMTMLAASSG